MPSTLTTDDILGIMLVSVIATTLLAPGRLQSWYYTLLARYHEIVARLARTEVFIFFIFLYLFAEDACNTIIRAVKPWLLAKIGMSDFNSAPNGPTSTSYEALPHSAPVNHRFAAWVKEDAEHYQALQSRYTQAGYSNKPTFLDG